VNPTSDATVWDRLWFNGIHSGLACQRRDREAILAGHIASIIWLDRPEDRPMRARAVLGDRIGLPALCGGFAWFEPEFIRVQREPGATLLLGYCCREKDRSIAFCLGHRARQSGPALVALRAANTPFAAERKWSQFIARFGAFPTLADAPASEAEHSIPFRGGFARVRRPVHPSALIDRLMQRDRTIAGDELERFLAGSADRRRMLSRPGQLPTLVGFSPSTR
jgi:hypothetical protein